MLDPFFDCPSCKAKTKSLTLIEAPVRKLGCPSCHIKRQADYNVNLGQTVLSYREKDGTKGRITVGKAWEIDNRRTTPDGIVVNKITNRPAQY